MENTAKKPSVFRRILKVILIILLVIAAVVILGIGYLSIVEYKPADIEIVSISDRMPDSTAQHVVQNTSHSILTWNIGYGALGDNADFFMDGGTKVITADKNRLNFNMNGIISEVKNINPEFLIVQEADINSTRSLHVNLVEMLRSDLGYRFSTFAYNFNSAYIPYPIPPLGHVESGLVTLSDYDLTYSERVQLPCPFSWPMRIVNLKRCLMADTFKVYDSAGNDTGKELVIVNLHLEAYDDGQGKIMQAQMVRQYLQDQYERGNYVIAGGDFNQTFSNCDTSAYPKLRDDWQPGVINAEEFSESWSLLMDPTYPTCRSLIKPYTGESPDKHQFYMIDGFIVSDNIRILSIETIDEGFTYTDHNPVLLEFELD